MVGSSKGCRVRTAVDQGRDWKGVGGHTCRHRVHAVNVCAMRPSDDWSDSCDDLDGGLFQGLVNSGRVLNELGRVAMTVSDRWTEAVFHSHTHSHTHSHSHSPLYHRLTRTREVKDDEKEGFRGHNIFQSSAGIQ